MLIVSHALHCVVVFCLYFPSFDSLVYYCGAVLDDNVSFKQMMSIRSLKEYPYFTEFSIGKANFILHVMIGVLSSPLMQSEIIIHSRCRK